MALPTDFARLTLPEQLFVLVDLERIARHLPPLVGLVPVLNADAHRGAALGRDPDLLSAYGVLQVSAASGFWAANVVNPVAVTFDWIYNDGWGGAGKTLNYECTSPQAAGCWGHRDGLFGGGYNGTACTTCVAGGGFAGHTKLGWDTSYSYLIVEPARGRSAMSFTWNADVLPYLPVRERLALES